MAPRAPRWRPAMAAPCRPGSSGIIPAWKSLGRFTTAPLTISFRDVGIGRKSGMQWGKEFPGNLPVLVSAGGARRDFWLVLFGGETLVVFKLLLSFGGSKKWSFFCNWQVSVEFFHGFFFSLDFSLNCMDFFFFFVEFSQDFLKFFQRVFSELSQNFLTVFPSIFLQFFSQNFHRI